jgi:cellulose synthase operon protein YhjQ
MTEFNPQSDQNATPEDVATLYSWANLHGAKYRDFSAARAQTREKARLRAEQALEEDPEQKLEQEQKQEEVQATDHERDAEVAYLAAIKARQVEQARQAELAAETAVRQAEGAARWAAEQEADRAAQEAAEQTAKLEAERAARQAANAAAELAAKQAVERAARQAQEQQAQELRAQEQQAEEQRVQEQRIQDQRVQDQQAQEQRVQEQRVQDQRAQERAAQLAAQQAADRSAEQAAMAAAQHLAQQRAAWQQLQPQFQAPPQPQPQSRTERFFVAPPAAPPAPNYPPLPQSFGGYGQPQGFRPPAANPNLPQYGPAREQRPQEEIPMPRSPWATPEAREPAGRPAWLSSEAPEASIPYLPVSALPQAPSTVAPASVPLAPEDTLQGSRDRLTSRWFALRGVFDGGTAQPEVIAAPAVSRAPAMAVFSLAGGVGKTSLVATLGRALSSRGERVLLVDTAAFGLLPFFFGATDQRPGLLRTFSPPGVSSDAPIQMVTIDPEGLSAETPESLSGEISKFARGASRVIVDLATASGATTRRIMRMSPLVLVPVIPDMNSVVSVSSIDAFFEHNSNPAGQPAMPWYVLNQFDASLPLHLDVREVLREQLGERLLPFALRRTPAMSEALAEGMTVMDYAPGSPLAEDFTTLAAWVKSLSSPATTSYRGVRWSER